MSDVQIESNEAEFQDDDAAFDAEMDAARQAQDGPVDEPEEQQEEEREPVSKDVEKLERIAADKSRAFKEERRKRQESEARYQQLEARLAAFESKSAPKRDPLDFSNLPAVDADPITNLEALRTFAEQFANQQQTEQRQTQAQAAQDRQFQQINQRMTEYEADFREMTPDYDDAATHFREARTSELEEMGFEGAELQSALRNDLIGVVARAVQSGKDPAEVVYKLAKNRGFGGAARKEVVDGQSKKLQTIDRGQKAGRSLSNLPGKPSDGEMSGERLLKLDGQAFDDAFAALSRKARQAGA